MRGGGGRGEGSPSGALKGGKEGRAIKCQASGVSWGLPRPGGPSNCMGVWCTLTLVLCHAVLCHAVPCQRVRSCCKLLPEPEPGPSCNRSPLLTCRGAGLNFLLGIGFPGQDVLLASAGEREREKRKLVELLLGGRLAWKSLSGSICQPPIGRGGRLQWQRAAPPPKMPCSGTVGTRSSPHVWCPGFFWKFIHLSGSDPAELIRCSNEQSIIES